jgi:hypothetical protein
MFNSFLDSYLKIFYSRFPLKRVSIVKKSNNNWITSGILTSCKHKREFFIACRNNNNLDLVSYYKKYCKILSAFVKEAKKLNYGDKINKAPNKNKIIWDIIKLDINKTRNIDNFITSTIEGTSVSNFKEIANEFNKYFLSIAKNINTKFNSILYFLCVESTATRPITDTAQCRYK